MEGAAAPSTSGTVALVDPAWLVVSFSSTDDCTDALDILLVVVTVKNVVNSTSSLLLSDLVLSSTSITGLTSSSTTNVLSLDPVGVVLDELVGIVARVVRLGVTQDGKSPMWHDTNPNRKSTKVGNTDIRPDSNNAS